MEKLKSALKFVFCIIVSAFAMMTIMEKWFSSLPDANYLGVYIFGSMTIVALLYSWVGENNPKKSTK